MNSVLGGKVAMRRSSARTLFGMPSFRVHQTSDAPGVEAQGQALAEVCGRLIEFLVQAADLAGETWRRKPIGLVLVDARGGNFERRTRWPGPAGAGPLRAEWTEYPPTRFPEARRWQDPPDRQ